MPLLTVSKSKIVRRHALIQFLRCLFCCFLACAWLSSCSNKSETPSAASRVSEPRPDAAATPKVESDSSKTGSSPKTEAHQDSASAHSVIGPRVIKLSEVEAKRSNINTDEVKERPIARIMHLTGHIEPDFGKEVDVSSRINGKVIQLLVKPGQTVKAGEVLAVIDSREISELQGELVEARSKLQIAQAHRERERVIYAEQRLRPKPLIDAQSKCEQAKVKRNLAESEFKRQEGLFKEKIAATKDFLTAKANLATANLEYEQMAADLAREQKLYNNTSLMKKDFSLADAEYTREKQHFHTLEQHVRFMGMDKAAVASMLKTGHTSGQINIIAPAAGVISHHEVAVGEIVSPDKSLFKITDLSTVVVGVDVPEVDLQYVKVGSKAKVKIASYPDTVFDATISYISEHVRKETRTLTMRARLDNKGQRFKLNMYAEVDLSGPSRQVLACPTAAVQERKGKKIVFVAMKDGFEERIITTGDASEDYVEVKSGLSQRERVVTQGSLMLKTELN